MVLILLALISFNFVYAQPHHQCLHNADGLIDCVPTDSHHAENFAEEVLDWWAATDNKVKNAKCQNAGAVSEESMLNYINRNNSAEPLASDSFFGIQLEDESPHKIALLKKLTEFDGLWNIFDEEKNTKSQKTFNIPSDCKKVICAAKSIFGENQGPKLLYLLDKYELNLSHEIDDNITAWKDSQLDTILEAVDDLPAHLIPFERNQYFKHYKNGYGPSASTLANATITFYDPWDDLDSSEMQMYTVIHEIGHNIGSRLNQDEDPEWLNITGWMELDGEWKSYRDEKQVSKYGATNPAEDFAEAFSGYRYDPERLKRISPKKYEYMKKNVFLGLEYTSEAKCQDTQSTYASLLNEFNNSSITAPGKYGGCKENMTDIIHKKATNIKECIEKAAFANFVNAKGDELSNVERDAIVQAASFSNFSGERVSDEQELKAYKEIIGDFFGSIAESYSKWGDDCSMSEKYGNQDLFKFNEYQFGDQFEDIDTSKNLNALVASICEANKSKFQLKCEDLAPHMQEYFPSHLGISIDPAKVKMTTETDPNSFRCLIE